MNRTIFQRISLFLPVKEIGRLGLTNRCARYSILERKDVWNWFWHVPLGKKAKRNNPKKYVLNFIGKQIQKPLKDQLFNDFCRIGMSMERWDKEFNSGALMRTYPELRMRKRQTDTKGLVRAGPLWRVPTGRDFGKRKQFNNSYNRIPALLNLMIDIQLGKTYHLRGWAVSSEQWINWMLHSKIRYMDALNKMNKFNCWLK